MFNLYDKYFGINVSVKCSTVIDNILYVVITEGTEIEVVRMVTIDLSRMIEIESEIINYRPQGNNTHYKIFGNELYCYTVLLTEGKHGSSNNAPINTVLNLVTIFDIKMLTWTDRVVENLRNIVEIGGRICYINYVRDDNNEGLDSGYYLCDMYRSDIILRIIDGEDETYFENNVLHLSFNVNIMNGIYTSGNYLIVMTRYATLIYLDIDNGVLFERNMENSKEIHTNIGKSDGSDLIVEGDFKYYVDRGSMYHDIGNGKLFGENNIYDYVHQVKEETNLDVVGNFVYEGHNYYIHMTMFDDYRSRSDYIKNFNISIDIKKVENNTPIKKGYPEYITVGSKFEAVQMPLSFIYGKSQYIQDMVDISEGTATEFINDNHEDIYLYLHYLDNGYMNMDNLDKLYKIASLMMDTNMEYLTYLVLDHVKNFHLDINEAWVFLEMIYNNDMFKKFDTLLYIIFKKFSRKDFLTMIADINQMNNDIFVDLVKTRVM